MLSCDAPGWLIIFEFDKLLLFPSKLSAFFSIRKAARTDYFLLLCVTKKKLIFLSRAFLTNGGLLLEKADPKSCFKGLPGWLSVLL